MRVCAEAQSPVSALPVLWRHPRRAPRGGRAGRPDLPRLPPHRGTPPARPPLYGTVGEAVEYDFDDVTPTERADAADILIGAKVPYRWEDGYRLFVAPESEAEVDKLFGQPVESNATSDDERLDDDEGRDEEDLDDDGFEGGEPADWVADEEAVGALARLFDAADRLRHRPDDEDAGAELADVAGVVLIAPVPFVVNRVLWATAGILPRSPAPRALRGKCRRGRHRRGRGRGRAVLVDHV